MTLPRRCLCGILIAAPILLGNDATKAAKIDQLMMAMNIEQQETQMMAQTRRVIAARLRAQFGPQGSKADVVAKQKKVLALVEQRTSWQHLKPIVEKSYADAFSEQEIDGILAFYRSPAGQAMVQKMPLVSRKITETVSAEISGLKPQIDHILNAGVQSK